MAYFRLFRRVRIAPGLSINLTKAGPSLSLGVRGAHVTLGRSGIRKTLGVPGTGVFFTSRSGYHTGAHTGQPFHDASPPLAGFARLLHAVAVAFLLVLILLLVVAIIATAVFY
jgi:Protein of unknown function (DUF4236)